MTLPCRRPNPVQGGQVHWSKRHELVTLNILCDPFQRLCSGRWWVSLDWQGLAISDGPVSQAGLQQDLNPSGRKQARILFSKLAENQNWLIDAPVPDLFALEKRCAASF